MGSKKSRCLRTSCLHRIARRAAFLGAGNGERSESVVCGWTQRLGDNQPVSLRFQTPVLKGRFRLALQRETVLRLGYR